MAESRLRNWCRLSAPSRIRLAISRPKPTARRWPRREFPARVDQLGNFLNMRRRARQIGAKRSGMNHHDAAKEDSEQERRAKNAAAPKAAKTIPVLFGSDGAAGEISDGNANE